MKKVLLLFLAGIFYTTGINAKSSIEGKVLENKSNNPIELATIRLLQQKDSAYITGALTDEKGIFDFKKIENGKYILEIKYLGYKNLYKNIEIKNKNLLAGDFYMKENVKLLKAVEVKGNAAQMIVKEDTIEYNVSAFKTAENAVVEDLLKKLPGVEVDKDGNITVNGEKIKKVRVDGKKFFDDDVQMATKNIPVNIVDKVQVTDQKSEMAELTGFEDENTERIINLKIKKNRKKGIFGNITGGIGSDVNNEFNPLKKTKDFIDNDLRYNTNAFLNIMNGEMQTAIIAGANNTNTMRSGRGRGGFGSGRTGTTETQNLGINNNSEINDLLKIGGNISANHSNNFVETDAEKESWLKDSTYINKSESKSTNDNKDLQLRTEAEWKIDSLTTLILQPNISYTKNHSKRESVYSYYITESEEDIENLNDTTSWGKSKNNSHGDSYNGGLNLILNKKSRIKRGRSYTFRVNGSLGTNNSNGENYSEKNSAYSSEKVDQQSNTTADSYSSGFRFSLVEPLWNLKNLIELSARADMNYRTSVKDQYNDDDGDGNYTDLDSTYSSNFKNNFYKEAIEIKYRKQDSTYRLTLGIKAEPAQTKSKNKTYNGNNDTKRTNNVVNYAPSITYRYKFGRKKFARIQYRGRTNQPSIDQIQPIKNNNNLMNETIGNSKLNPSFTHRLRIMYSSSNPSTFSSLSAGLNGEFTKDALITNSIYDNTGKEWRQTVNAKDIPYSINAILMYNIPIKKKFHFNTRTNINYRERFGYSDKSGTESAFTDKEQTNLRLGNKSRTISSGINQNLSFTYSNDFIEIGLRGYVRYANTANSLNNYYHQETWDWTSSGNINLYLPYNTTISTDLNYTTREGYSSYSNDQLVWNASLDKSIFNKKGTLSLKIYDILQQKLSVNESVGDNYRSLSKSNMITSYFTVNFTYRIAKFAGGAKMSDMMRGRRRGFYRGRRSL